MSMLAAPPWNDPLPDRGVAGTRCPETDAQPAAKRDESRTRRERALRRLRPRRERRVVMCWSRSSTRWILPRRVRIVVLRSIEIV
jgi:hypothetical protein